MSTGPDKGDDELGGAGAARLRLLRLDDSTGRVRDASAEVTGKHVPGGPSTTQAVPLPPGVDSPVPNPPAVVERIVVNGMADITGAFTGATLSGWNPAPNEVLVQVSDAPPTEQGEPGLAVGFQPA